MNKIPRLAVTPGEPAGIGPDLIIQLAQQQGAKPYQAELVVIADKAMMQSRAQQLNIPVTFSDYQGNSDTNVNKALEIKVLDIKCSDPVVAGELNKNNAQYVLNTLTRATEGCLSGEFDAVVTAPLHKGIINDGLSNNINDAGLLFTGHTEFLADLTKAPLPVMMLAADNLRVALATTHLPLKDVSDAITKESLRQIIEILHHDLVTKFGIKSPHILICGLNPHAGEGGHLGMEEIETIEPVIKTFQKEGMNLTGPLPADTLFTPKYLETADAVLAMYHDQGLPVLKHVGFGHAINVTLGLPIIRTSVDHGTALDLAGSGKASTGSLMAAFDAALEMINSKTTYKDLIAIYMKKEMTIHSIRPVMLIGLLISIAMIGVALFFQHYMGLIPCPLCIVQRVIVMVFGGIFLLAFIQGPKSWGKRIYGLLLTLTSIAGVAVAGRHTWLQHLPAEKVPECGPGLDFWMKNLPTNEVIQKVFQGSGECAEVVWKFVSLSIPEWSLIAFGLFFLYSLKLLFLAR